MIVKRNKGDLLSIIIIFLEVWEIVLARWIKRFQQDVILLLIKKVKK